MRERPSIVCGVALGAGAREVVRRRIVTFRARSRNGVEERPRRPDTVAGSTRSFVVILRDVMAGRTRARGGMNERPSTVGLMTGLAFDPRRMLGGGWR